MIILLLFILVNIVDSSQCIVCHKAESHYRGKGEVLKRWQSAVRSTEITGHAWIPKTEFKEFSRKFSAWLEPRESFYSSLNSKSLSQVARIIKEEIHGYDEIVDRLENNDVKALEILRNPFHQLELATSQNYTYSTTIESRIQKVLLVFGGTRERMQGVFNLNFNSVSDGIWSGKVSLDRWGKKSFNTVANMTINSYGELNSINQDRELEDPLLQNCAWIFQRPRDLNQSVISLKRPIALETGRVIKQRGLVASLVFDKISVSLENDAIFLNVVYSFDRNTTDSQIRVTGGQGTAKVNLAGVLTNAHAELELSVRAFGVSLKAWMEQWIDLNADFITKKQ